MLVLCVRTHTHTHTPLSTGSFLLAGESAVSHWEAAGQILLRARLLVGLSQAPCGYTVAVQAIPSHSA